MAFVMRKWAHKAPEAFKAEAAALSAKLEKAGSVRVSGLSTLLVRLKWEERALHGATKTSLLAVAEYVLDKSDYSRAEYNEAVILLAKYHLAVLVDRRRPGRSRQLIGKERVRDYTRRCARCGLLISSKKSLESGFGRVCRGKAGLPRTSRVVLIEEKKVRGGLF